MTWAVVVVLCYLETGCRVYTVTKDFDSLSSCLARVEFVKKLHKKADYISSNCYRQYKANT